MAISSSFDYSNTGDQQAPTIQPAIGSGVPGGPSAPALNGRYFILARFASGCAWNAFNHHHFPLPSPDLCRGGEVREAC